MTHSAKAALLAFALLFAGHAYGQATHYEVESFNGNFPASGNDFVADCPANSEIATRTADSRAQAYACLYYVLGVAVASDTDSPDFLKDRTVFQLYDIVAKFIANHPELRSEHLVTLTVAALKDSAAH